MPQRRLSKVEGDAPGVPLKNPWPPRRPSTPVAQSSEGRARARAEPARRPSARVPLRSGPSALATDVADAGPDVRLDHIRDSWRGRRITQRSPYL